MRDLCYKSRMRNLINWLFGKPEDEAFVAFVQVAMEDQSVRDQVMPILTLEHNQRRLRLEKWKTELLNENAPAPMIEIVDSLNDERLAARLHELLIDKP